MLHNIEHRIHSANDIDSIYLILAEFFSETERILNNNRFTLEEVRELSCYIEQIRLLITEIDRMENRLPEANKGLFQGGMLKELYLDLEGKVKEMRNDKSVVSGKNL